MSGDPNLKVAGMERDWPEGRGIYHNKDKTFLTWVNEEDQLRIISMQKGGDVKGVFDRLARGIKAVGDSVKAESGKDFMLDEKYGYVHSCPLTSERGCGPPSTSTCRAGPSWGRRCWRPAVRSCTCSRAAPGGNPEARLVSPTTSRTSTDSATVRSSSCRR